MVPSRFDPDKELVQYGFEIDGEVKLWDSGSAGVARQFDKIPENTTVTITRAGLGTKTRWTIEPVKKKAKAKKK